VDAWFVVSSDCPLCKRDITTTIAPACGGDQAATAATGFAALQERRYGPSPVPTAVTSPDSCCFWRLVGCWWRLRWQGLHLTQQPRRPAATSQRLQVPWESQPQAAASAPAAAAAAASAANLVAQLGFVLDAAHRTENESTRIFASQSRAAPTSRRKRRPIVRLGLEPASLSDPQSAAKQMAATSHMEGCCSKPEADSVAEWVGAGLFQGPPPLSCIQGQTIASTLEEGGTSSSTTIQLFNQTGLAADDSACSTQPQAATSAPAAAAAAASAANLEQMVFVLPVDAAHHDIENESPRIFASQSRAAPTSRRKRRPIVRLGLEPASLSYPQSAAAQMAATSHMEGCCSKPEADSVAEWVVAALLQSRADDCLDDGGGGTSNSTTIQLFNQTGLHPAL
jgi:hypothetical protein